MENSTSYDETIRFLKDSDLIAPAYFIVGGLERNEGIVITRNQVALIDEWRLNDKSSGIENWFLVETNYDHWLPPPSNDDRRTPAIREMNRTTQLNLNYDTMFDVLSTKPVCNK